MIENLLNFWRNRYRPQWSQKPVPIPAPVDDNQYIASSANAGVYDRETGAYDKYLFSEQEIAQMPYEAAVDSHLELMSTRLEQRFGRFLTRTRREQIKAEKQLERAKQRLGEIEAAKGQLDSQLATQASILAGDESGKEGLIWRGEMPVLVGTGAARLKIYSRYFLFSFVALVDAFIIWSSFISINIRAFEALALTVPALAAQVIFPHFIGIRFRLIVRGMHKKVSIWLEVALIAAVWLTFVVVITGVRVIYIRRLFEDDGVAWNGSYDQIFTLLNVVLITALGAWLLFSSVRENHHETEALKLKIRLRQLDRKLGASQGKLSRKAESLALANEAHVAMNKELDAAIRSSRLELGEAAKSVYRRALINEMKDPEFTKSYYQGKSS